MIHEVLIIVVYGADTLFLHSGAFIHLKDAELALAVEACLKGLISAFCCDNHSDERVLQKLMSECCPPGVRPQIIVSTFRNNIYDVRQR